MIARLGRPWIMASPTTVASAASTALPLAPRDSYAPPVPDDAPGNASSSRRLVEPAPVPPLEALASLPLLQRAKTEQGIPKGWRPRPDESAYLGVGLGSPKGPSVGLPFDALGYLAFGEDARRRLGHGKLVVHVADTHALANAWADPDQVRLAGAGVSESVSAIAEVLRVPDLVVTTGSELDLDHRYRQILAAIPAELNPYVRRELADIRWHREHFAVATKIGWVVDSGRPGRGDESAFDAAYRALFADDLATIYCVPGRNDDSKRMRTCPYSMLSDERRVPLFVSGRDAVAMPASPRVREHLQSVCELAERLAGLDGRDADLATRISRLSALVAAHMTTH